jgi:hypothetical protein
MRPNKIAYFALPLLLLISTRAKPTTFSYDEISGTGIIIYDRMPGVGKVKSVIMPLYYGPSFDSYEEAITILNEWISAYGDREIAYSVDMDAWRNECERIKRTAEDEAEFKEYSFDEYRVVPVYYEDLGIWVFGWQKITTNEIVKVIPKYELPKKPVFNDTGYKEAMSAYSYLKSDGLNGGEWRDLKFVLYTISEIEGGLPYDTYSEEKLTEYVDEGLLTVTIRDRSFWEAIAGEIKGDRYVVEYTDKGYRYFAGLIERCWDFRNGLIEAAYGDGVISDEEYGRLHKDNRIIRGEFLKQLEKKENWRLNEPHKLKDAFVAFTVYEETALKKFPYARVLNNIPDPPKPITE